MSVPRFWREIPQRYNLQASECGACSGTFFPPREVCPTCRRASLGKMSKVKLSGVGTIVEWTWVHKPAPGFELQLPYLVALIQSPEGPILTGQIVDHDRAELTVGSSVRAVFRRIGQDGESGVIHYGTKWVLDPPSAAGDGREISTTRQESAKGDSKRGRR
ncbi:MAG: Zn-ribbon domain-containing OB-fold protein [Candidatus Thermoplasmatota archaeon]